MIFKRLQEDIDAFMARDPAARSRLEILLCYPGLHAVLIWRFSSYLWRHRLFLLARLVSHLGRLITAIEIHPGARIGRRFVIDHGTGVVIGETADIGDDVTLYQGVTLGGIAPSVDSRAQVDVKRHPTLQTGVIVGSGAQILGPIVIGEQARVGANSVVTRDVAPGATAIGIPAHLLAPRNGEPSHRFSAYGTPAGGCPDPMLATIEALRDQVITLATRLEIQQSELQSLRAGTAPVEALRDQIATLAARLETLQSKVQSMQDGRAPIDGVSSAAAEAMPGSAAPSAPAIGVGGERGETGSIQRSRERRRRS